MAPIEYLEIANFGIGALIMSTDEALRRSEYIHSRWPRLHLAGSMRFVPAAFLAVALGLFIGNEIAGHVAGYAGGAIAFIVAFGAIIWLARSEGRSAVIPVLRPSLRPTTASSALAPEYSDLSGLIDRWFDDRFRGTALVQTTAAWNAAHAAKEDLKTRLQESGVCVLLSLEIGESPKLDEYRNRAHLRTHIIRIGVTNMITWKEATNCEFILEHISGWLGAKCPVVIRDKFSLNPRRTEYIPIVQFEERINPAQPAPTKPGPIRVLFPLNPNSEGNSYLEAGSYEI